MKIIGCGDIHMSPAKLHDIPNSENADLIILTGDLTNYGSSQDAKTILDNVMSINPHIFAQVGNLDHFEINDYLEELNLNIHGQARLFKGTVCIVGVGGSNITPFKTPTEFTEEELFSITERAYLQGIDFIQLAEPLQKRKIPTMLVSHTPPHNTTVDTLPDGAHVGSTAIREIIEKYQPDLCITGHIHEAANIDTIGKTPIINPGMLCNGGWIDINVENSSIKATLEYTNP